MTHFWTSAHLRGDSAYVTGYMKGRRFREKQDIHPYLFVEGPGDRFRTLDGKPVALQSFNGWQDVRDFLKRYEGVENKPIYGMSQFLYTHLNDEFPGEVQYDPTILARASIDIETMSDGSFPNVQEADKAITAITLSHRRASKRKIMMFGYDVYKPTHPEVRYMMCRDEAHMLSSFLEVWNDEEWTPDVLTGWYIEGFDVPYIINRIKRVLGEARALELSPAPFRYIKEREIARGQSAGQKSSTQVVHEIFGVSILDYMELYKKFSFKNQESYKLDHIAFVELKKRKKDYSRYGSLHEFFVKDYQGYMDYNLEDTILIDELDEKLGLIDLVLAFAYDAKVTFNDTMTTTRPWDVIIHNYLLGLGIVVPQSLGSESAGSIVGGYVKEVTPGLYRCVSSFDFDSLYPKLIIGWNISPETYVGRVDFDAIASLKRGTLEADVAALKPYLDEMDAILAGNGCLFSRSRRGFLAVLMEKMYEDRVEYKRKMLEFKRLYNESRDPNLLKEIARYHNLQLAKKIQLNSAFGALANEFFRWFANYLAEAVTMSGQMSTMWTEAGVNGALNRILKTTGSDYVIAADTDSIYLNLGPLVDSVGLGEKPVNEVIDFMDRACKASIQGVIKKRCQALTDMVGCPTNALNMKRESLADKGIWTAKKKYILNVWDLEGVRFKESELKVTGIESVRSSTPMICRDSIKKALRIIVDGKEEELQDFILAFRDEFRGKEFHEVAAPRGVNNLFKYTDSAKVYAKGTPIQVRGALLFNKLVKDLGLVDKYPPVTEGSKVRFCYLKVPNPIRENVIAVPDRLPPEFGLDGFIDYELQYDKSFVSPISKITDAIGWKTEKSSSLLDFL